ncbi:MAG: acyl carrier protein [Pseudomonadota bacterium]
MNALQTAKKIVGDALHIDQTAIYDDLSADTSDAWDSVAHINIMLSIEEQIGGGIPVEEVFMLNSVSTIAAFLDKHTPS